MPGFRAATREKKQHVAETALRLFAQRGYDQVSVGDIIEATGTSKGTFYHYFRSKEELLCELPRRQCEIVRHWSERRFPEGVSAEGRVNSLLLELSRTVKDVPLLVRSLYSLSREEPLLGKVQNELAEALTECLSRWLLDGRKAKYLYDVFTGTLWTWATGASSDLESAVRANLMWAWRGLADHGSDISLDFGAVLKEEPSMEVAVIGGGLAGLTAAAYLSRSPGIRGVVFERSPQWGGRAFTYEKAGFTLNYGAHAIYGIDRHTIGKLEKELELDFSSRQVDKRKVMYEKGDQITPAPLDFINLLKTDIISAGQKVRFVAEITAMMANIHQLRRFPTLGDYLAQSGEGEDLKELWEHLVCSNFFISPEDARRVPGHVIADYYHNLFLSQKPVNYILGSWAVITEQLKNKIGQSGRWELAAQEGADSIRYEGGKYWITTKNREAAFDRVVFAMPVQQVVKLLKGTPWEPFMVPFEANTATEVLVYDVGLSHVVSRPFSYISDMNNKMFISDVSATDDTLVPQGGQLLQGIAYLSDESFEGESDRKAYLDERQAQMEALFDRHYPGWRDAVAVKRMSKKAMVQSVKHVAGNRLLPNRLESVPFFFCGDGCSGKGELAERAFSSAREAAALLLQELAVPVEAG
ncbi:TetR family transcriptional regulator [Cohnella pontilimi]|uniref:TetR family transcriptional regulator n=1 Tax=Cohnella pontilimi TaxID=2564100 RepID=A0A4U0FF68_9BACL|nr:TetR family transcriptional regulator [Cohnella pontilimi]